MDRSLTLDECVDLMAEAWSHGFEEQAVGYARMAWNRGRSVEPRAEAVALTDPTYQCMGCTRLFVTQYVRNMHEEACVAYSSSYNPPYDQEEEL